MTDIPIFSYFRDLAFKSILSTAFKAFPKKIEEVLAREGWQKFVDFMAAVERSGRVLMQFEGRPRAKTVEEHGADAAVQEMLSIANTDALNQLLSGAFFGEQNGEIDRSLARKALFDLGIPSWHSFSMAVMEIALQGYAEATEGKTPMDTANPDTLLFYGLPQTHSEEVILKVTKAFGLPSPRHLIALSEVFWSGDLTMEDLDRAIGDPELLTEMVNRCPSNPFKGIVFSGMDNPS